jgi:ketosteroid isomerase-like protein
MFLGLQRKLCDKGRGKGVRKPTVEGGEGMKEMARLLSLVVTVSVLGAVVWWTQNKPKQVGSELQPDSVIWEMIDACRRGDVDAYLNCFTGDLRKRLEKVASEQGKEKFSDYLKEMLQPIKNIALQQAKGFAKGDQAIVADFVFADRTERQTFWVRRTKEGWKIVGVEATKPVPVLVPYGTPVKGL